MISKKLLEELSEMFKSEKFENTTDYSSRLQDFTNESILEALSSLAEEKETEVLSWWDLQEYLLTKSEDPEIKAHLMGYESSQARKEWLKKIKKKLQRLTKAQEKKEYDAIYMKNAEHEWHDSFIATQYTKKV